MQIKGDLYQAATKLKQEAEAGTAHISFIYKSVTVLCTSHFHGPSLHLTGEEIRENEE